MTSDQATEPSGEILLAAVTVPNDPRADLLPLLDRDERTRWQAYAFNADKARFALGAMLLRVVAGQLVGVDASAITVDRRCPDCTAPHGRPRIVHADSDAGTDIDVSLSHSGDRVLVAAAQRMRVGVDVERIGPAPFEIGDQVFTSAEAEAFEALPMDERAHFLLRTWTRKEALLKAGGDGLRVNMRGVEIAVCNGELAVARSPYPASRSPRIVDLNVGDGHVAALAVLDWPDELALQDADTASVRELGMTPRSVHPIGGS